MHYRRVDSDALSFGIERRDDQTRQTVPLHDLSLKIEKELAELLDNIGRWNLLIFCNLRRMSRNVEYFLQLAHLLLTISH